MKQFITGVVILCLTLAFSVPGYTVTGDNSAAYIPMMSKEELKTLIGDPGVFILDVRLPEHYRTSPSKIKGAIWLEAKDAARWSRLFPKDKIYILY